MGQVELSIIIINYKTPTLTLQCLESIYSNTTNVKFEVIVVDNFSEDNIFDLIRRKFPETKCIQMNYNSGFARANNVGIKESCGDYILFLNSDTILLNNNLRNCLDKYQEIESQIKIGLMGCQLLNEDDSVQLSSYNYFPSIMDEIKKNSIYIRFFDREALKKNNFKNETIRKHNTNHITKWLCGAYLMTNNMKLKKDKLYFDESYFLYSEDVNLCYDFMKKGYSNYYFKDSKIKHLSGVSSSSEESKQLQITLSNWKFQLKSKGELFFRIFIFIVKLNYWLDKYLNKKTNSVEINQAINFTKKALSLLHLLEERKDFLKI